MNTGLALDKGIQLANKFECDIHLLHVQTPSTVIPFLYEGFISGSFIKSSNEDCIQQLEEFKLRCKSKLKDGLQISSAVLMGQWHSVIKETIISEHIDLVIIPKSRRRFGSALIQRLNLNRLSQQTRCPVLTVTRSFNVNQLNNIVVPVNDFLPIRKLSMATYLSKELNGNIHLMGNGGNSPDGKTERRYLIKAYHLLNEYGNVKIHCSLPGNFQQATSTLDYAKNVHADLIVVNTGKEALLKGWWNKLTGKYLYKQSDIPVLTIAPQADQIHTTLN